MSKIAGKRFDDDVRLRQWTNGSVSEGETLRSRGNAQPRPARQLDPGASQVGGAKGQLRRGASCGYGVGG